MLICFRVSLVHFPPCSEIHSDGCLAAANPEWSARRFPDVHRKLALLSVIHRFKSTAKLELHFSLTRLARVDTYEVLLLQG